MRNDSLVTDFESLFGDSLDFGRGPLLMVEYEHIDKFGVDEASGTDDVVVLVVRYTAVTNSKNSVVRIVFIDQKDNNNI